LSVRRRSPARTLRCEAPGEPATVLRRTGTLVAPRTELLNQDAPQLLATDAGAFILASLQLARCPEAVSQKNTIQARITTAGTPSAHATMYFM
jgi:hypothetical protein